MSFAKGCWFSFNCPHLSYSIKHPGGPIGGLYYMTGRGSRPLSIHRCLTLFTKNYLRSEGSMHPDQLLFRAAGITVAWNWSRSFIARIIRIAAVAFDLVPKTSFRSVDLPALHRGHDNNTLCIAMLPALQSHIDILQGTRLSLRNWLKPILPIRSWVSSALWGFFFLLWRSIYFDDTYGASFRRWSPCMPFFHRSFHLCHAML